jgi:hypothetical protein
MTRALRLTAAVAAALAMAPLAWAQTPGAPGGTPAAQVSPQVKEPSAESMGVSLRAIRQQFKEAPLLPLAPGAGLRYDFFVDVLGKRPAIEFFKDFDLSTEGAVKWGGVTHQEILNAVTPFPFQHYGMGLDVLSLIRK